jgi:hypothetical protein
LLGTVYTYLTSNEPSNEELSKSLIDQLIPLQALYQTRSTTQLLKDVIEAIKLKE